MAWEGLGSLKGPQGADGPRGPEGQRGPEGPPGSTAPQGMTADERAQVFGSSSYTAPPYGSLVWSGASYVPARDAFTRLKYGSDGRLRVNRSTNGAAVAANDSMCYLYAPVNGLYLLSAVQCWAGDSNPRGAGLTTNMNSAVDGLQLWADIGLGRFVMTSSTVYLTAGTRLYPWIWSGSTNTMAPSERGRASEYSIQYVGPG